MEFITLTEASGKVSHQVAGVAGVTVTMASGQETAAAYFIPPHWAKPLQLSMIPKEVQATPIVTAAATATSSPAAVSAAVVPTKPFSCHVCQAGFVKQCDLKRHAMIHTGEKPFTCHVCQKSFKRKCDLKRHEMIHTGEKPFTCQVCQKNFTRKSDLKRHNLIHTGEKPFTCDVCQKSFTRKCDFKQHSLIHSGQKGQATGGNSLG